ncbi:MAG: tRNA epoxyqueuosine(34) reductase QueG [Pyrinomonadaceae bacterium]
MPSLSDIIKKKAIEIGFHKIGIVAVRELAEERSHLEHWLARGYQGEMLWMEREPDKRSSPRMLFPGARSVIVVGLNYYTPHEHANDPDSGKISRYAWGDDYHDVLKEKLRVLLDWIKMQDATTDGKICVDTAPIMDKAWAVRAGIGWLGKHSNVITPDYGSWIFIGEILLNLDLEYETAMVPDHCGTCTMCLDACPTSAIVEPYIVDSQKCLSYATIELRSETLPSEIEKHLEGWLYGCDICQDVCPWNRFEKPTAEARFEPRNGESSADLEQILSLTPEKYAERFRGTAVKRAKLPGLKRNAVALHRSTGPSKGETDSTI